MVQAYEIEIKSLLGDEAAAALLVKTMCEKDPACSCVARSRQLNHYFIDGDLPALTNALTPFLSQEACERLTTIAERVTEYSVRSRQKDDSVLFVVKASTDDTTSENGISRLEFEELVPLSLSKLDEKILAAGFSYQAKWSREREEYAYKGATVCIDKNAGYGYLAEFEKMVNDPTVVDAARDELRALMAEVGVEELPQARLERMFSHYNGNWREYYGTDKTFVLE